MGSAHVRPALAGFRHRVTELTEHGLSLGEVQDAIDAQPALTEDQRAALWLFAFSLRDRSEKQRQARAVLAVAQASSDHARPREFDAKGFPVPQRNRSFLERVARLLNPE
jgi:DNA-binding transcriptional MerR regulator